MMFFGFWQRGVRILERLRNCSHHFNADNILGYLREVIQSLDLFRRFWPYFNAEWYLAQNADVKASGVRPFRHFLMHGWREGRDPCSWLSITGYLKEHPTLVPVMWPKSAKTSATQTSLYRSSLDRRTQIDRARSYRPARSLVIFFNVAHDTIGGGMLSINRFVACALDVLASDADTQVVMSCVPLGLPAVDYKFFKAASQPVEFQFIVEETDPDSVSLFIPEMYAVQFAKSLSNKELKWVYSRKLLKIIVMNQNSDLMPPPNAFKEALYPLTNNIIISTAHTQSCTKRNATRYGVPVKQLTPLLPAVRHRTLNEKDRLILLSPDPIERPSGGLIREKIILRLQSELPDFEFVTVQNLSLERYLDLASRAMFSLTFGEGLDGYFIEPVLGGGVSFAVYNSAFFPKAFEKAATLCFSWDVLLDRMPEMVRRLSQSEQDYVDVARELRALLSAEYSDQRSRQEMAALLRGEIDHLPGSWFDVNENFLNIKEELKSKYGFHFVSLPVGQCLQGGLLAVRTPDELFLLHWGGEFYSVLYEVYVLGHYDLKLKPDHEYIFIDIGANFGLVSLYLSKKYPQIRACYAYEPAEPTFRLALKNIEFNPLNTPINMKMIGLSDRFSKKTLQYIPDWSTAFSTDDDSLLPYLNDTTANLDEAKSFIEVEVVPAHTELAPIISGRGDRKVVIKCDTQGAEFGIIEDLNKFDLLKEVDIFMIESHFRDPSSLLDLLRHAGFDVHTRLDSAENQVFTIHAHRHREADPKLS